MTTSWARKCERYCCFCVTYFPLFFVYSLTTWAVWVETQIGSIPTKSGWIGNGTSCLGVILYLLSNWSYTTAVFTSPGTTTSKNGYSSLPTHAPPIGAIFTVKANGELRYCKKCQTRKPDRAHHCSTCRTCILKMDHHCPWLATCVGLRNYKAFLLFLGYTTLFCIICFSVSAFWVWNEILSDREYTKSLMPINFVILAVVSGIIGILLAGFTGWHIVLASRGQTTIECLEKTRYLSARKYMLNLRNTSPEYTKPSYSSQIDTYRSTQTTYDLESPRAQHGERITYDDYDYIRSRAQYDEYLDEQDSDKLPSAFDLGWKQNLLHLFGHKKLLWLIPIPTTTGDGWNWDPNPKWLQAKERILQEIKEQRQRENAAGWGCESSSTVCVNPNNKPMSDSRYSTVDESLELSTSDTRSVNKADRILGRSQEYTDSVLLDSLRPRNPNSSYYTGESTDRQEFRNLDRKVSVGRPQNVGVFTKTLYDKKTTKTDEMRVWDGRDEGVD